MIDHLGEQTNDWLENGVRGDSIAVIASEDINDYEIECCRSFPGFAKVKAYKENSTRTASLPLFDRITTPVDSIFLEELPEPEPIVRPATVPKKVRNKLVEIKPNQFISYQAIADFCDKVGEL